MAKTKNTFKVVTRKELSERRSKAYKYLKFEKPDFLPKDKLWMDKIKGQDLTPDNLF
jgi:hypothetical protein